MMDGYFGPASAMSTILLVVTGLALFVLNKFFGLKKRASLGRRRGGARQ